MPVSINTSELVTYKKAIIDGVELGVRPLSSAETLEILNLQEESQKDGADQTQVVKRLTELAFGVYDNPEKAKEIMSCLSFASIMDIYKRILESD